MPNIASVLKSEITRLSNKAARQHVGPVHASTVALRKQLTALKGQVAALQREITDFKRRAARTQQVAQSADEGQARFTAKGFRALRSRLDLSAAELGILLEVGPQTIYNWESGKTQPRPAQVPAIAALRKIGKREARSRLAEAAVA
jgi:DNA-binding transcriptional regulator YiaG